MQRFVFFGFAIVCLFGCFAFGSGGYDGGNGMESDPYQIRTAGQLHELSLHSEDWDKCFVLTADIDISGITYSTAIIAANTSLDYHYTGTPFTGRFDGGGFAIKNLTIDTQGESNCYLGLFGSASNALIKNLGLENVSITGGDNSIKMGGLCAFNGWASDIINCYVKGTITGKFESQRLGGICGSNDGNASLTNCYADVIITSGNRSSSIGALCGSSYGRITNCYGVGSITLGDNCQYIGGLSGMIHSDIINCYANTTITSGMASLLIGGFCGANNGDIIESYSASKVTAGWGTNIGGFCGNNSRYIINCFWDAERSGIASSGEGNPGATGKTTSQMQMPSTYLKAGWAQADFQSGFLGWVMQEGSYPEFAWQNKSLIQVPDLTNLDMSEASERLVDSGLEVGNIYSVGSMSVASGNVSGSSVFGGGLLDASVAVDLYVSNGSTGDGTESTPYNVSSYLDLEAVNNDPGAKYIMTSDIYMSYSLLYDKAIISPDTSFSSGYQGTKFAGVFDGDSHKIKNIRIKSSKNSFIGLFGNIRNAEIRNLGLEKVSITDFHDAGFIGGLCGISEGSYTLIDKCYIEGKFIGGREIHQVGGLCGSSPNVLSNSYSNIFITSQDRSNFIGGLCGYNTNNTINQCYSNSVITTGDNSSSIGGLFGTNASGTIKDCYSTGMVKSTGTSEFLGGLCGFNDSDQSIISNCYSSVEVNHDGSFDAGGLCVNKTGVIENCYFYIFSGPDRGEGTGLGKNQMTDAASFKGFDFTGISNDGNSDIWAIVEGHSPKLSWQSDDGPMPQFNEPVTTLAGKGISADPFQINNHGDFMEFSTNASLNYGCYILNTDIDLIGESYSAAVVNRNFGGRFDGNGFAVSNMTIDTRGTDNDYLGLFKSTSAYVGNLKINNAQITGGDDSDYLGGVSGYSVSGRISDIFCSVVIAGGNESDYLGGITGENSGAVRKCFSSGTISSGNSSRNVGGLCGFNSGTISECHATDTVTAGESSGNIGGLCGWHGGGTIDNCYATGAVSGGDDSYYLGGLLGKMYYYYSWPKLSNCYATGQVAGGVNSSGLGGLCGYSTSTVSSSFWDTETSGLEISDGGTDKTNVEMQSQSTYTSAGWDFVGEDSNGKMDLWYQMAGDYPRLFWEAVEGDCDYDGVVGVSDLGVIGQWWMACQDDLGADERLLCDFDFDGVVNLGDFMMIAGNWLGNTGL